jgi:hypothetical protein
MSAAVAGLRSIRPTRSYTNTRDVTPADIGAAIDAFISRRDELERDFGLTVSRALEGEVRAGIRRLGLAS